MYCQRSMADHILLPVQQIFQNQEYSNGDYQLFPGKSLLYFYQFTEQIFQHYHHLQNEHQCLIV